jgi:anaerobic magnesium-protoporphyrin IX monomethyl ester cyclase
MMFHGAYTSDFYRTVRNLMHDQVALQTAGAAEAGEQRRARVTLDQRWRSLLACEHQFRSPARQSAAG